MILLTVVMMRNLPQLIKKIKPGADSPAAVDLDSVFPLQVSLHDKLSYTNR